MRDKFGWVVGVAIVCVLIAAATALYMARRPWVQVIGDSVLRTNAPTDVIAAARYAVVHNHQHFIEKPNGKKGDPTFHEGIRTWTSGLSRDEITAKVTRGRTQIIDKDGHVLSIEQITSDAAPMLIFIEFEGANGAKQIVSQFLMELESRDVTVR